MAALNTSTLKERCERLYRQLVIRKLITEVEQKEISSAKPRSRDDWWERYATLKSYARRIEWEKEKQASATTGLTNGEAESLRIRMLLAEPVSVKLDDGKMYKVYPKSYNALCMIVSLDYAIAWLVEMADDIATRAIPEAPAYLPRVAERIGHLQNIMCDIILHDGPGFDRNKLSDPTPYDFSPMDLMSLQRAHNDVNVVRMMALPLVTKKKSDKADKATGWSDFFVIMGMQRHIDPATLMEDEALNKLIAMSAIKADSLDPVPEPV